MEIVQKEESGIVCVAIKGRLDNENTFPAVTPDTVHHDISESHTSMHYV